MTGEGSRPIIQRMKNLSFFLKKKVGRIILPLKKKTKQQIIIFQQKSILQSHIINLDINGLQ